MVDDAVDTCLVTYKRLQSLLKAERFLNALEDAGVDNWSGYDYVNWDYVETGEGSPSKVDY